MAYLFRCRLTVVWLFLLAATALSWKVGHGTGLDPAYATAAIIVVAFVKVRLVILDFMEIRNAPLFMRIAAEAWVLAVCGTLIAVCVRGG